MFLENFGLVFGSVKAKFDAAFKTLTTKLLGDASLNTNVS